MLIDVVVGAMTINIGDFAIEGQKKVRAFLNRVGLFINYKILLIYTVVVINEGGDKGQGKGVKTESL